MLLLPLLLVVLTVTPSDPGTMAPASSDFALLAPHAGKGAEAANQFLAFAGRRAPILRAYARSLERSVGVAPFSSEALAKAGVDPEGPLVLGRVHGSEFLVFRVKHAEAVADRAEAWLSSLAAPRSEQTFRGNTVKLVGVNGDTAAFSRRGVLAVFARAVEPKGNALEAVKAVADAIAGKPSIATDRLYKASIFRSTQPWRVFYRTSETSLGAGAFNASFEDGSLVLNGRIKVPGIQGFLARKGAFGELDLPSAFAVVRFGLSKKAFSDSASSGRGPLRSGIAWLFGRACPSCDQRLASGASEKLARVVSGQGALVVDRLDLKNTKRIDQALSLATLPHVQALRVRDTQETIDAIEPLLSLARASKIDAPASGQHWVVEARGGQIYVGVLQDLLYVANDREARDRALPALLSADKNPAKGPAEAQLRPSAIAEALGSLSLGDAFSGGAQAALFGLKLELGPLLQGSGLVRAALRESEDGSLSVNAAWDLSP